jgi:hypothetical protein
MLAPVSHIAYELFVVFTSWFTWMNIYCRYNYDVTILSNNALGKAIPVTGRGDPYGCETSIDNRLTSGDNVVSLTRRPSFTPRKIPGTHFC